MTKFWNKPNVAPRIGYRESLVALWTEDPSLKLADMKRLTGAPQTVIRKVRADLIAQGGLRGTGKYERKDRA